MPRQTRQARERETECKGEGEVKSCFLRKAKVRVSCEVRYDRLAVDVDRIYIVAWGRCRREQHIEVENHFECLPSQN